MIEMDEQALRQFMKKEKQSEVALKRCISAVLLWEKFLKSNKTASDDATVRDLQAFADRLGSGEKIKPVMHGLSHWFKFLGNQTMRREAIEIRGRYLPRNVLKLKDFVGVRQEDIAKLRAMGITDADRVIESGATESKRRELECASGLSSELILALVKMSDLSRIFGLKGIRARLYFESGIDTVEKMATMNTDELIAVTKSYIERTGFSGIPPTPKEAQFTIEAAKTLHGVVEY